MFDEPEITNTYEVDGSLRKQLEELQSTGIVEVLQTRQVEVASNLPARQVLCKATYAGETVTRFDTVSPLGLFSSHQGDHGMVAALILATSLHHGEPTLVYKDQTAGRQDGPDYIDFTSEWYGDPFVEKGLPQKRMELRPEGYEAEEVTLGTLEERAECWFASH